MNIAYIITVYHKPAQLVRLIKNLKADNAWFYIHLDKTKPIADFQLAFREIAGMAKVKFLKREDSRWGRWGFTKAMLNGFNEIRNQGVSFDYVLTLSGQDQPIKPVHYINEFLEANKGKNFIEHFSMPNPEWNWGGMDRLTHYHFDFLGREYAYPPKKKLNNLQDKIMNQFFQWYFPLPRVIPLDLQPYGGSCWFCITFPVMKYIIDYLNKNPEYENFHRFTYLPDEIFFQTILMNSPDEAMKESIVNENLLYLEWQGEAHVVVFTEKDYGKLATSEKLFARKFDLEVDQEILKRVEEGILYPEKAASFEIKPLGKN